jgi:hypothetical protein
VLRIVKLGRCGTTSPQLRERRLLIRAGAFDIHHCVPGDPALAVQLGTKLAGRAQLHVIGKELVVDRVRAPFDDDAVRLQHKSFEHAAVTATAKQERDPGGSDG